MPTKGNNRTYRIYKSAGDERNRKGVAFLVDVRLECFIERVIIKGHTVIGMNIKGKNNTVALIQCYIPDISAKKEDVLKAYEIVEELMEELNCKKNKQVIVMGNINGRTGKAAINGVCGQFGSGETNRNGRILLDFCMKKKLRLKNTYKPVKERKNFSWIANHGCGKSLFDYIAINEKYSKTISRCKVVHKVDKLSDNYLVVAKVKIQMAKPQRYTKTAKTNREWLKD